MSVFDAATKGSKLGGSIEPLLNPDSIAVLTVKKGAVTLLIRVTARRQLYDLLDVMVTKVDIQLYQGVMRFEGYCG